MASLLHSEVDELIKNGMIDRITAGIEIDFSNSLVEALFSRMKHAYLYMQSLTTFNILVSKTDYYLDEHNNHIPHSALSGAVPIEVFVESWTNEKIKLLRDLHAEAQKRRVKMNRSVYCGACPT